MAASVSSASKPPSTVTTNASPPPTTASTLQPSPSPSHGKPPSTVVTKSSSSKPPSIAPPPTTAKPRSTKPPKAHSRSPSPPPPPPPMQTIRLEIRLGGPDNYEVDIARQARETGQRAPTPLPIPVAGTAKKHEGGSGSESESEPEGKDKAKEGDATGTDGEAKKKKKKKKKITSSEYYDVTDPFIDDSELAIDERTYFAQTKQQGFYVSSGEVALLKDKTPKKPKSKKNPLGLGSSIHPSTSHPHLSHPPTATLPPTVKTKSSKTKGTRESPIPLNSDDSEKGKKAASKNGKEGKENSVNGEGGGNTNGEGDGGDDVEGDEKVGEKRKRYVTIVEGGKKRKVVDINSFHPDLQASIEELKKAIAAESWAQKGKFPPTIKPLLSKLAVQAIKLDEYDDHFFNLMPTLFPYNKFTMMKLIKRTVFHDHIALLVERQDALLRDLKQLADEGFSKAEDEWERAVIAWDKRQEKLRLESAESGTNPGSPAAPTRQTTEEMDVDHPSHAGEGVGSEEGKENKKHTNEPPGKRYRFTDQMKVIIWELVLLSNECCRLENEKNDLENSVIQVSEQGSRKNLYQKIVAAFPEGWMSSGQISRDVSAMKKRLEKEQMENET